MSLSARYASIGSYCPLLLRKFSLHLVSRRMRGWLAASRRMSSDCIRSTCVWMNRSSSSSPTPTEVPTSSDWRSWPRTSKYALAAKVGAKRSSAKCVPTPSTIPSTPASASQSQF